MEGIREIILTIGIIVISLYSVWLSHENVMQAERITHQIELMFVKS